MTKIIIECLAWWVFAITLAWLLLAWWVGLLVAILLLPILFADITESLKNKPR